MAEPEAEDERPPLIARLASIFLTAVVLLATLVGIVVVIMMVITH